MLIFDPKPHMRLPLVVSRQRSGVSSQKQRTTNNGRRRKAVAYSLFPLLAAALCLLLSAYCLFAASGRYEVREVKPHVFVWVPEDILDQDGDPQFNRAGTAGFVITSDGVVAVDTTNSPSHARELLFEIRRRTELLVKYVINTGSEGDRALGNEVFVDQQSSIISTSAAQAEMRRYQSELAKRLDGDWRLQSRMRGIHATPANRAFDGEMHFTAGDQEIKLLDFGGGDAAAYLPLAKVLFLGDLFENKYIPRIGTRDMRRWIDTLRTAETWDVDVYVPGHGSPGSKKEVAEFRGFLEWLLSEVEARVQQGKSPAEVKSDIVPFKRYAWRASELASEAVQAVYKQLAGQASPVSKSHASALK